MHPMHHLAQAAADTAERNGPTPKAGWLALVLAVGVGGWVIANWRKAPARVRAWFVLGGLEVACLTVALLAARAR